MAIVEWLLFGDYSYSAVVSRAPRLSRNPFLRAAFPRRIGAALTADIPLAKDIGLRLGLTSWLFFFFKSAFYEDFR